MMIHLYLFRTIAFTEAISFLLLLGIAMPLKHLSDMPQPVKFFGWIHGLLFMAYIFSLMACWMKYDWSWKKIALLFVAALLPFGPFVADRKLLRNR